MTYKHKRLGFTINKEEYDELNYLDKSDFELVKESDNFLKSAAIGALTDSSILGGLLGGSITGGILGDILDGDLMD